MKIPSKPSTIAAIAALLFINAEAMASVAYNVAEGWDSTGTGGEDGHFPATWAGVPAPGYSGPHHAMWYANVDIGGTENVSTSDARAKAGAGYETFALAVGPRAWNDNTTGTQGQAHGSDFGLIRLNGPSDLAVTVSADKELIPNSNLKPGFSLFEGWAQTSSLLNEPGGRAGQTYQNNANNPLATGLIYQGSALTTTPGGSASFLFTGLAAGDYTLFVGGNFSGGSGAAGKYTVNLAATAVPIPAAVWLFGSALAGMSVFGRRKSV